MLEDIDLPKWAFRSEWSWGGELDIKLLMLTCDSPFQWEKAYYRMGPFPIT